jgi:heme-degrading monooxygenase HmoA
VTARTWRGWTRRSDADAYVEYLRLTGMREYRETSGDRAAYILRREEEDSTEFVTLTFWDSIESVKGFAGEDVERAVLPQDDRVPARSRDVGAPLRGDRRTA